MATNKNITMKQFNGTDYDTLYPQTIGAQITGAVPITSGGTNGTTAPSGVNNLVAGLSQIAPASNDLFPFRDISGNTGGSVTLANLATALGDNGVITSSNLAAQSLSLGFSRIQTGSYVGTGTTGANNPCSLTFNFRPLLLFVYSSVNENDSGKGILFSFFHMKSLTKNYDINRILFIKGARLTENHDDMYNSYCKFIDNSNTIYWYSTKANAYTQLNALHDTYQWTALA